MKISGPAYKYLTTMGWSESRRVDSTQAISALEDDGYRLFPAAHEFLASLSGLEGDMPSFRSGGTERIHFKPDSAILNIYRERVETYEQRVGESLVVIGEANNGHMVLLLSETGRMFGGNDDFLCELGSSMADGLRSLFEGREGIEVA